MSTGKIGIYKLPSNCDTLNLFHNIFTFTDKKNNLSESEIFIWNDLNDLRQRLCDKINETPKSKNAVMVSTLTAKPIYKYIIKITTQTGA